ncbi:hypothetical protein ACFYO5_16030 [Streptomyces sp. NPDC006259]|uniref:hypothetical protein n=1 Tax=Streptomyces sp. NPDC006259 TaxID=3364740 RepID=UPI0036CE4754
MTPKQAAGGAVDAVVVDDGLRSRVDVPGGPGLPSGASGPGASEPAESPQTTATRLVH